MIESDGQESGHEKTRPLGRVFRVRWPRLLAERGRCVTKRQALALPFGLAWSVSGRS